VAHKFDIINRKKLDSEERKRLLAPYETLTNKYSMKNILFPQIFVQTVTRPTPDSYTITVD
jgi:hypothetical protein